jgi:hypothetical protein
MAICELRCAALNEFAPIVSRDCSGIGDEVFGTDSSSKDWKDRSLIACAADKRKKQPVAGSFSRRQK